MQERNRESSKRNRKSKIDSRMTSKENRGKIKPKGLNPVEKRNQRIEENKKKSRRADNREPRDLLKKTTSYKRSTEAKSFGKKLYDKDKRSSIKKTPSKQRISDRPSVRKTGNLLLGKGFRHSECAFFGFGLIVAYLFLLGSSVDTIISEGLFFIYLGVLLFKRPHIQSQGIFIDIFSIGIILYTLGAFLPNLPFFISDWRVTALEQYDISFGFIGTIMPLKSLEAFIMLVASIVLYYHISCWKLNSAGSQVLLIILIGVTILAGSIQYLLGDDTLRLLFSENYERSPIKDYSNNLSLFSLVGGVGSVALFFDSYKSNKLVSVFGFIGALLSLFFLIHNQSFFYYTLFYGLSFLLILRLYLRDKPIVHKLISLIILLSCFGVFLYLNKTWWGIIVHDLGSSFFAKAEALWWLLYGSFKQFNIFGYGIATAHAILPQLSPIEYFKDDFSYRGSYSLTYISDFGLIGLVAFILFFSYWAFKYFSLLNNSKMRHRFFYALIVIVFFIRFVMSSEGLSVGSLLMLLIFLQLSLRKKKNNLPIFSKKFCQLFGVCWLCLGVFWISVSIANQPLLSDIRYRLSYADQCDENVDFNALSKIGIEEKDALIPKSNPNKYFLNTYQLLEANADKAEIIRTVYKTSFFDRNNPRIFLHQGYLLSDYDLNLANSAWDAYFELSPLDKLDDYGSLIHYSKGKYELLLSLEKLSYLVNEYAVEFALLLNDLDFQKYIESNTLDRFFVSNKSSQFQFLKRLLAEGFFDRYSEYISKYKNNISNVTILEAFKQKELANFENALLILRKHIPLERIDIYPFDERKKYIPRVFLQNYPDIEMGVVLMKNEIHEKNYDKALIYVDHILTMDNPPNYAYYWKAELLYRMNEYVDSWFAFVTYLEKAKWPQFSK